MVKKRLIFVLFYTKHGFILSRNFRHQIVGNCDWLNDNYNFEKISFFIDELIVLRLSGDSTGFLETVGRLRRNIFLPLTLGGMIDSVDVAKSYWDAGADKLLIRTALLDDMGLVEELAQIYGKQSILGAIDVMHREDLSLGKVSPSKSFSMHPTVSNSALTEVVGELFFQDVYNDGVGKGFCEEFLDYCLRNKPREMGIIVAGGAGQFSHFSTALRKDDIQGVATGNLFAFMGDGMRKARGDLLARGFDMAKFQSHS